MAVLLKRKSDFPSPLNRWAAGWRGKRGGGDGGGGGYKEMQDKEGEEMEE